MATQSSDAVDWGGVSVVGEWWDKRWFISNSACTLFPFCLVMLLQHNKVSRVTLKSWWNVFYSHCSQILLFTLHPGHLLVFLISYEIRIWICLSEIFILSTACGAEFPQGAAVVGHGLKVFFFLHPPVVLSLQFQYYSVVGLSENLMCVINVKTFSFTNTFFSSISIK